MKKALVVGYGQRGKTLASILESGSFNTFDPFTNDADYRFENDINVNEFDKVIICTPEEQKKYYIEFALKHKLNILVEKPLLFPLQQLIEWEKETQASGIYLKTAYSHKYEKQILLLKSFLDRGIFGEIYQIRIDYLNGTAENIRKSEWRDSNFAVVMDLMPHNLDLILFLLGESRIESAFWDKNKFENMGLDQACLHAQVDETKINCTVSYICWKNTFRLEIFGSKSYGILNGLEKWGNQSLQIFLRKSPPDLPELIFSESRENKSTYGIVKQWDEFENCVRNNQRTDLTNDKIQSKFYELSFGNEIFLDAKASR
jgi:predicted dehydrogenase